MAADIAQHVDIVEGGEPFGIVDHHGIGLAFAEGDEPGEDLLDAVLVAFNVLNREQLAAFILAGRIADACGAAAHQSDGLVARFLQPIEQHDLHQGTHMQ